MAHPPTPPPATHTHSYHIFGPQQGQWGRGRQSTLPPITHGCSSCHLPGDAAPQGIGSGRRGPHSHTGTRIHGLHHCKGPGLRGETGEDESEWTLPAKIDPCPSAQMQETPSHPDNSSHRASRRGPLCSGTVAHQRCSHTHAGSCGSQSRSGQWLVGRKRQQDVTSDWSHQRPPSRVLVVGLAHSCSSSGPAGVQS